MPKTSSFLVALSPFNFQNSRSSFIVVSPLLRG